ncbi:hypothetical protein TNCV_4665421 [Trichonephila clavipes]|nr:hypothetical protein TNCV_4665421 [Trichonephila clavipes]
MKNVLHNFFEHPYCNEYPFIPELSRQAQSARNRQLRPFYVRDFFFSPSRSKAKTVHSSALFLVYRVLCVKPPSVLCATPLQRISQEEVGHRISRSSSSGSLKEDESLTTRILAEDFNVNQSTVVRRLKKLGKSLDGFPTSSPTTTEPIAFEFSPSYCSEMNKHRMESASPSAIFTDRSTYGLSREPLFEKLANE